MARKFLAHLERPRSGLKDTTVDQYKNYIYGRQDCFFSHVKTLTQERFPVQHYLRAHGFNISDPDVLILQPVEDWLNWVSDSKQDSQVTRSNKATALSSFMEFMEYHRV